ncbi:MAG: hypothetical protein GY855_10855 [candidate division Zixibacteria bacterium]|nr:hypothetical protein [candidate division Zixibacteria bacterium]
MSKKIVLIGVIAVIAFSYLCAVGGEEEAKKVAELTKDRLEWSGFWYGETRMGLPYGERLTVLVKDKGNESYDVVIDHPLNIPSNDEQYVPFNSYYVYLDILVEEASEKSFLRLPDELKDFKSSGAVYTEYITLDKGWLPVQATDSISIRFRDNIAFDMDKYFTSFVDSFPALEGKEEIELVMNKFKANDREVYLLVDGVDEVFYFKVHKKWPYPEMQHFEWGSKDIKFFNKELLTKIKEFPTKVKINIVDEYPIAKGMQ